MTAIASADRIAFRDVATSEWTKLRSLRSTGWSFAAYTLLSIGVSVLAMALTTANWDHLSATDRHDILADPTGLILEPGGLWGQIAVCVLGAIMFAGEYSTGTVRASMLAVPRRTPVLAAKAAVFGGVTFVIAEVVAFISFFVGRALVSKHVSVSLGDPGVLRAIIGTGLSLALVGLFSLSLGVLIRHTAGAITSAIGLVIVLPTVMSALPGKVGQYLGTYVPGGESFHQLMSSGRETNSIVTPWQGFGIACAWTAVALVLATVSLRRRDV